MAATAGDEQKWWKEAVVNITTNVFMAITAY